MFVPMTPMFAPASAKAALTAAACVVIQGRNHPHESTKQALGSFETAPTIGSEAER